jgi:hypothetical protein
MSKISLYKIMSDIKTQLTEEMAQIEWKELIPHAQRDAIIVVNESLSLIDVAIAMANDDVVSVQEWIGQSLIHKPSVDELSDWNSNPEQKFNTLIVQPFVLIGAA